LNVFLIGPRRLTRVYNIGIAVEIGVRVKDSVEVVLLRVGITASLQLAKLFSYKIVILEEQPDISALSSKKTQDDISFDTASRRWRNGWDKEVVTELRQLRGSTLLQMKRRGFNHHREAIPLGYRFSAPRTSVSIQMVGLFFRSESSCILRADTYTVKRNESQTLVSRVTQELIR
jgi:hypothetical protein